LQGRFHLLATNEVSALTPEKNSLMPGRPYPADLLAYLGSLTGVSLSRKADSLTGEGGLTFAEIAKPKPGDWPSYHGDIGGNRHSPLDQIATANVQHLALQWVFPINLFALEVTPVVVDGVMFVTGPNQVFAIDGRAGHTIWHYQRPMSREARGDPAKGTNRGVAVLGDRVFLVTDNARLLALHRVTGQLLWETDLRAGLEGNNYGNTAAPLVVNDMVVAGISGSDLGIRGFLSAYNAATGEPLSETWQGSALAKHGRATTSTPRAS